MTDNLYAAPQSPLEPPRPLDAGFHEEPLARGAGAGMSWLGKGWNLFMRAPAPWLLLGLAAFGCFLVFIVIAMIPILGALVQMVVQLGMVFAGPILLAGFYMTADRSNRGETIEFGQFFDGFRSNIGQLLMVGLLNFAVSIVFSIVLIVMFAIVIGVTVGFAALTGQNDGAAPAFGVAAIVLISLVALFAIAVGLVINLLFWFAPMLVAMNGMTAVDAIKLGWRAGRKNLGGYLVFCLLAFLVVLGGYITCGLGLLVALPVLACSSYSAYREIFYGDA